MKTASSPFERATNTVLFIAFCLLLIPVVPFVCGFLKPWITVGTMLLLTIWFGYNTRYFIKEQTGLSALGTSIAYVWKEILLCAVVTTAWITFAGVGGIGYRHFDWYIINTTFHQLVHNEWPVWFTTSYLGDKFTYQEDRPFIYYFGYYLPAAALGKLAGWPASRLFLYAWTWLCTQTVLLLIVLYVRKAYTSVSLFSCVLILVGFCFFGGLDWWGNLVLNVTPDRADIWSVPFVYFSNTRLAFWSPHNTLPIWLLLAIIVHDPSQKWASNLFGPTLVAILFWTPIGLIGAVPFILVYVFVKKPFRIFLSPASILISLALFILIASFILSNSFSFPVEWLPTASWLPNFTTKYLFFLATELGAAALIFYLVREEMTSTEKQYIYLALFLLIIIPFIRIGLWNDWCSKTAMASLFVIAVLLLKGSINPSLPTGKRLAVGLAFALTCCTGFEEYIYAARHFKVDLRSTPPEFRDYGQIYVTEQLIGNPNSLFFRHLAKNVKTTKK